MLPKTKYARSDDVLIAYQVTGDGPVDVVLAPGTMSHLDLDWEIPRRALFFECSRDNRAAMASDRLAATRTLLAGSPRYSPRMSSGTPGS